MKKQQTALSDQVRQAIRQSGLSRYRISKQTGIDQAALCKFFNGQRGINTDTLDKLGQCLGLRIVMDHKPAKKGG